MTREEMIDEAVRRAIRKYPCLRYAESLLEFACTTASKKHGVMTESHEVLAVREEFHRIAALEWQQRWRDAGTVMRLGQTNEARWHRHVYRFDGGFGYCEICKEVPAKLVAEG